MPPCTKKKYYSQDGAEKYMKAIEGQKKKRKGLRKMKHIAAYKCPICGFFHLTSQVQYK